MLVFLVAKKQELEARLSRLNQPVRKRLTGLFGARREPREVYGLLSEFLSVEGKLLRPALCLASCEAVGGRREAAAPAAAAIEMFHNFTLIHDDIEDRSQIRRGKPCLHVKYGLPLALNAGDGLFMMVWQEALRLSGPRKEEAQSRLLAAFTKVLEGQAVELGWYQSKNWGVKESEYYGVVGGKTGALIAVACEVGGLLGGADEKTCRALSDFGMGIGVGFQIVDDALNIVGDVKKYGKEIGGDVREGKRTLITIRALAALPKKKKERLSALLKKERKSERDVADVLALLRESGAVESSMKTAEGIVARAMRRLDALPQTPPKALLVDLGAYITKRER